MKNDFTFLRLMAIGLCFLLMVSCKNSYFLCYTYEPVAVYETKTVKQPSFIIPSGKQLIVETRRRKFRRIKFGQNTGYVVIRKFPNEWKFTSEEVDYLVFNS